MEYTIVILVIASHQLHTHRNCDVMATRLDSTRLVFSHIRGKNSKAGAHYKGNNDKEKKPEGRGKNGIDPLGKTLWICINHDLGICRIDCLSMQQC